jgi:D-alanine-D-alanine ligase
MMNQTTTSHEQKRPRTSLEIASLRRRRIAVICGGPSSEREISLKSGAAVAAALRRQGLRPRVMDLTVKLGEELRRARVDLAFLALHGPQGEDGCVQGLLEILGIAYTGCGVRASALAMHKPTAKALFAAAGLPVPRGIVLPRGTIRRPSFPGPWVVKPASQGSAVGVALVDRLADLPRALRAAWAVDEEALVEERVRGTEITVGLLGERTLPVIEIIPQNAFYDFHSKYAPGGSRHVIPARLPARVQTESQRIAREAFHALGCRHVARVDLIVTPRGRPVILEVNTLPGMTDTSLLPDGARAVGLNFDRLVLTLLSMAARRPRRSP